MPPPCSAAGSPTGKRHSIWREHSIPDPHPHPSCASPSIAPESSRFRGSSSTRPTSPANSPSSCWWMASRSARKSPSSTCTNWQRPAPATGATASRLRCRATRCETAARSKPGSPTPASRSAPRSKSTAFRSMPTSAAQAHSAGSAACDSPDGWPKAASRPVDATSWWTANWFGGCAPRAGARSAPRRRNHGRCAASIFICRRGWRTAWCTGWP